MQINKFNDVVKTQLSYCERLLKSKGDEYSLGSDRLEAFKNPAKFRKTTPKDILFGYMLKHISSLSDMCITDSKNHDKWIEKITDTINYLVLLRALVEEDYINEKY